MGLLSALSVLVLLAAGLFPANACEASDPSTPTGEKPTPPGSAGKAGDGSDAAQPWKWELHQIDGRDYVADRDVSRFYQFQRLRSDGEARAFLHPMITMNWSVGSSLVQIRNINYHLNHPILEKEGMAMLSTLDLTRLLDPTLRPRKIFGSDPQHFDTVLIDPISPGEEWEGHETYAKAESYALDLASRLEAELQERGFEAVLTRREGGLAVETEKLEAAKRNPSAAYVGVLFSISEDAEAEGVETRVRGPRIATEETDEPSSETTAENKLNEVLGIALAGAVHSHVVYDLRAVDLGIGSARSSFPDELEVPAIRISGGHLTNEAEASLIDDPDYRQRLAQAMASGLANFRAAVVTGTQ